MGTIVFHAKGRCPLQSGKEVSLDKDCSACPDLKNYSFQGREIVVACKRAE